MNRAALFGLLVLSAASMSAGVLCAQSPRNDFLEVRRHAYEASYRNDQEGLRDAIGRFGQLASVPELAAPALYHSAWTRWMLAASETVGLRADSAIAALEAGVAELRRGLALQPDDAEMHALMAWSLMGIASADRARWSSISADLSSHRKRAVALEPRSPRVMIMEAGMVFYAPPAAGGSQGRAIALWLEALTLFDQERTGDSLQPGWGGALPYGWLANLYLQTNPPRMAEAGQMARKALEMRPDFWWVTTQVMPQIVP